MKPGNLILSLVLLVLVLFGINVGNAAAAECPIEVQVALNMISVTSLADTVTIQGVQINRGNLKLIPGLSDMVQAMSEKIQTGVEKEPEIRLPATLKFGEAAGYTADTRMGGMIREVEVQTNMGNWTFKFR